MALTQKYGIKYPFSSDNVDNVYMDMNDSYADSIKSQVLHLIFTPKGQKLRDPDFGTDLIKYIFAPNDSGTIDEIQHEITSQINKYIPDVTFKEINIFKNEENDNETIVAVSYCTKKGNKIEENTVAIKL